MDKNIPKYSCFKKPTEVRMGKGKGSQSIMHVE